MDNKMLGALHDRMTRAVAKAEVAASNLANLETPGYRTKEAAFADVLQTHLTAATLPLAATHPGHLTVREDSVGTTRQAAGLPSRLDGNNVQLDRELLKLSGAGGEFKRAATAYEAVAKQLRYAITEGK